MLEPEELFNEEEAVTDILGVNSVESEALVERLTDTDDLEELADICIEMLLLDGIDLGITPETLLTDLQQALTVEQEEDVSQESLLVNSQVQRLLNSAKKVTKAELQAMSEPADILLSRTPKSREDKGSFKIKAFVRSMRLVQRSPVSSSKLVKDQQTLIGYGLSTRKGNPLWEYSFKKFTGLTQLGVLVRYKRMTRTAAAKVIEYHTARRGLKYSNWSAVKVGINKITRGLLGKHELENKMDDKQINNLTIPLICSSVIVLGFRYAGIKLNVNRGAIFGVAPADFLISPDFEVICAYDHLNK